MFDHLVSACAGTQRAGGLTEAQINEMSEDMGIVPEALKNASSTVSWWQGRQVWSCQIALLIFGSEAACLPAALETGSRITSRWQGRQMYALSYAV